MSTADTRTPETHTYQHLRIVIVDDIKIIRDAFKDSLEQEFPGCEVDSTCVDGLQALNFLKHNQLPKIMIVDHDMPNMNGKDLVTAIRGNSDYDSIIIFLNSATSDTNTLKNMASKYPNVYILEDKGNPDELHQAIRKILSD